MFMSEVVERSDFGIDLHTGAIHRPNLPQIRANISNPELRAMAEAFGTPVILHSTLRPGSMREAAQNVDTPVLLYEAGEALRLDELPIRVGLKGILRIMKKLGMLRSSRIRMSDVSPAIAKTSRWIRAEEGGLFRAFRTVGDRVDEGQLLGVVACPYEKNESNVVSTLKGLVIGRLNLPVVNRGEALFHIARVRSPGSAEEKVDQISEELGDDPIFDEDEVL
jgi:predicted deacylase